MHAASRLAEPLPPPQGGFLLVSPWGRGARPGNRSQKITFPHCHRCPQSRGHGPDNGLMDNREQQMVSPTPTPPAGTTQPARAAGEFRVGAQAQLATDPSLPPAHFGFLERGLNWELRLLRDGK